MCQMIGKCTKVDGEVVCNAGKTLLDSTKDSIYIRFEQNLFSVTSLDLYAMSQTHIHTHLHTRL